MPTLIASTASIDPRAEIAEDVEIGPFCVIGPQVRIGRGTRLENSVTLMGRTTLGQGNRVYPGAVIGAEPQDLSYDGGDTEVVIGDGNVIRECVTINRATRKENGATCIGSDNYRMACCHVAHDTIVEDEGLFANQVLLAGHMRIGTGAVLSGQVAVHHFVTVGRYAFVGGCSRIVKDVPPFMMVQGFDGEVHGVNTVGLRRRKFAQESINALKEAHRILWRSGLPKKEAVERIQSENGEVAEVRLLIEFLHASDRGRMGRALEASRPAPVIPGEEA